MQLPIVLGLLCAGIAFAVPSDLYQDEQKLQGIVDDLINNTIKSLLANLTEPIEIASLPLNFTDSTLSGEASITDFKLSGLKKLVATKIDVSILSLAMNATIVVPTLALTTKYSADLLLAELIPLYGSGRAGITLDEIEVAISGKVKISPLSISNMTIQIGLGDALFDLHGLLNNEDFSSLLNQVLNDNVATFLNDYKKVIGDIISPIAQEIINSLLSQSSITDIFNDIDLDQIEQIPYIVKV